jgi:hypothetical protein
MHAVSPFKLCAPPAINNYLCDINTGIALKPVDTNSGIMEVVVNWKERPCPTKRERERA